ncbi:MAG: hypothetical protein H6Q44_1811, partial [Deltaproteobacteria bacterium]|nr:hypothetical protein [Deltaproteobacteria bacterium]
MRTKKMEEVTTLRNLFQSADIYNTGQIRQNL